MFDYYPSSVEDSQPFSLTAASKGKVDILERFCSNSNAFSHKNVRNLIKFYDENRNWGWDGVIVSSLLLILTLPLSLHKYISQALADVATLRHLLCECNNNK